MIYVESRVNNVKGKNHRNIESLASVIDLENRLPTQMYGFIHSPFMKMCELYFALLI